MAGHQLDFTKSHHIEVANDSARYFGLKVDWRTDKKPRLRPAALTEPPHG